MHDKKEFVIHIRNFKKALNPRLVLKKVHSVIKFNQKALLKTIENNFFKLMNNAVFGKTMVNVRNHRDIKLVTNEAERTFLAVEMKENTDNNE